MFLLRGVKNSASELRAERTGEDTFKHPRVAIPEFDTVGQLIGRPTLYGKSTRSAGTANF
jgi:hypothetical protein